VGLIDCFGTSSTARNKQNRVGTNERGEMLFGGGSEEGGMRLYVYRRAKRKRDEMLS